MNRSLDKTFDEVEGLNLLAPVATDSPASTAGVNTLQKNPPQERSDSYEATLSQISYLMQKLQQDSAGRDPTPNQTSPPRSIIKIVKAQPIRGSSTNVSSAKSWVSSVPCVVNKPQSSPAIKKSRLKFNGTVEERLIAFGKQTTKKKSELREQQEAKLDEDFLDVKMAKVPITKLARCSSEHVIGVPISDRLYQYGLRSKDRKVRLAIARIADEEAKMKSPVINAASQKCNRTVEDLLAWDQRKNQRHNQMRLSKENSFSISQQPLVCKGTLKIVEKMKERAALPLEDRLTTSHKQSKIEELKKELSRQEMDAIESTKVPMSETSKQIIAQKHDRDKKIAVGIRLSQNRRHSCFYEAPEKIDFTHVAPKENGKNVKRPTSAPRECSIIPIEDRLLAMGELYEEKKKQEIAESNLRSVACAPKLIAVHENSSDCVWNRLFQEKILMNKGQRISCQAESPQNYFDKLDDIENCTFRYINSRTFVEHLAFLACLGPQSFLFIDASAVLRSQLCLKSLIGGIQVEKLVLSDLSGCMSGCVKMNSQNSSLLLLLNF